MKMLTAYTRECDIPEEAIAELTQQLGLPTSLKANSAGFITCSYDFVESGILQEICQAMPFPIVGCTTLTGATAGECDTMLLSLSVLTDDECTFAVVETSPLTRDNLLESIRDAYEAGIKKIPERPAMILSFCPMLEDAGSELLLNALEEICDGVPIFGTMGCDGDISLYANTYTFINGKVFKDCMGFMLIQGPFYPRFFVKSVVEDKIQKQKAIITASEGSVLKEVNGISAAEYLESIGLAHGQGLEALSTVPFVIDYHDGTPPVARAIYMVNEENHAICGGAMPQGATLSVGVIAYEDVLSTARQAMDEVTQSGCNQGLIMFPCLGRNLVLGLDNMAEIKAIEDSMPAGDQTQKIPYQLAYSGGEICPLYAEGRPVNRYHNYSFIACAF